MKDKNIEEILSEFDKKFINNMRFGGFPYKELKQFIENALQKSKQQGRLKELDILEAHINTQIYQQSINTESLLQYISSARENIIKNS